jgi:hypothetical protein
MPPASFRRHPDYASRLNMHRHQDRAYASASYFSLPQLITGSGSTGSVGTKGSVDSSVLVANKYNSGDHWLADSPLDLTGGGYS